MSNTHEKWKWTDPLLPVDAIARVVTAALCLAALANTLLVKVAFHKGIWQWAISISAGIVAILMADRAFITRKLRRRHAYASLLSTSMWYANVIEVLTALEINQFSRVRQACMYLSFAIASGFLFLTQKIILHTRKTGEANVT